MNINQVTIVGRLVRDPEMKALPSGTHVTNSSIATSRTWTDKGDGQKKEEVEFHNVIAFGKTAEVMAQWLKKGQLVGVTGRLQTRSWEDADSKKKMYRTEIVVDQMQMGPKAGQAAPGKTDGSSSASEPAAQESDVPQDINPDDIPF